MYKRVLLKLSGEALSGKQGFGFEDENALRIAEQIKDLKERGVEVGLVIGGGNIWRGRNAENTQMNVERSHQIGILATVINAIYMVEILKSVGLKARVVTPNIISGVTEDFDQMKINDYLERGEIVVLAGGVGQPFFTTDTGAALNALKINADVLLLAKNVDGVYDKDPKKDSDAKKYDRISHIDIIDKGLSVMDLTAVSLCMENNLKILVFDLNSDNSIIKNAFGDITGTIIE